MRTLSMLLCLSLCLIGIYESFYDAAAGGFLLCVGGLAFMIIAPKTNKLPFYNPKHWMNK